MRMVPKVFHCYKSTSKTQWIQNTFTAQQPLIYFSSHDHFLIFQTLAWREQTTADHAQKPSLPYQLHVMVGALCLDSRLHLLCCRKGPSYQWAELCGPCVQKQGAGLLRTDISGFPWEWEHDLCSSPSFRKHGIPGSSPQVSILQYKSFMVRKVDWVFRYHAITWILDTWYYLACPLSLFASYCLLIKILNHHFLQLSVLL